MRFARNSGVFRLVKFDYNNRPSSFVPHSERICNKVFCLILLMHMPNWIFYSTKIKIIAVYMCNRKFKGTKGVFSYILVFGMVVLIGCGCCPLLLSDLFVGRGMQRGLSKLLHYVPSWYKVFSRRWKISVTLLIEMGAWKASRAKNQVL